MLLWICVMRAGTALLDLPPKGSMSVLRATFALEELTSQNPVVMALTEIATISCLLWNAEIVIQASIVMRQLPQASVESVVKVFERNSSLHALGNGYYLFYFL